jgi:hypothetical protein
LVYVPGLMGFCHQHGISGIFLLLFEKVHCSVILDWYVIYLQHHPFSSTLSLLT